MTTGRRILIIDEAVIQRIDQLRGEMGRPEFITLCVETALQDLDAPEEESSYPEEEYALLKGATRYLRDEIGAVKEYLRGPSTPREAPTRMAQASHQNMGVEVGRDSQGEAIAASGALSLDLNQWWLLAIVLFGFGDTLTSLMVFARGGTEANPLMSLLLPLVGNNLWGFVVIKTLAVVALLYLSYKQVKSKAWVIPAVASALGGYLVLNNLVQFFKLS